MDSPELVQLAQRVRLRFHLGALSREDLRSYVKHRLEIAGAEGREIFAEDTFAELYRYSGGVPRLVNTLCDTAMMAAFNEDRDVVQLKDVASAVSELQWVEFSTRASTIATSMATRALANGVSSGDRAPRALAKIVLSNEGKTVAELHLVPGRKVIGRTPDNDLQVDSKFISRHHCQLVTGSDGITVIEDLNSTNGIVVAGKRVRRHTLRDGDIVSLGQHEILYVDGQAEHLADTHDDLPSIEVDAANEDADEDAPPEGAAGAR
jgi:hypothetical protein